MSASEEPAVTLENVSVRYGELVAARDVSLEVAPGEIHALLGQSGSGKTTLLRALAGLEPVAAGRVCIGGRVVEHVVAGRPTVFTPPEQRSAGFVFQDYALFSRMSVADNVAFGRRGLAASEVSGLLERVGLPGHEKRMPGQLSGGQQQRVALARALAQRPAVLLLDEPFSNVDRALRRSLRVETLRVLRAAEVTAIFVTHDVDEAFSVGSRLSVMSGGRLLQTGTPREVYETPRDEVVARSVGDVEILAVSGVSEDVAQCALGAVRVRAGGAGSRLLVRPEQLVVTREGPGVSARVVERTFLGADVELLLALGDMEVRARLRASDDPAADAVKVRVEGVCVRVD